MRITIDKKGHPPKTIDIDDERDNEGMLLVYTRETPQGVMCTGEVIGDAPIMPDLLEGAHRVIESCLAQMRQDEDPRIASFIESLMRHAI